MRIASAESLRMLAGDLKSQKEKRDGLAVLVSMGTCGLAAGGKAVYDALRAEAEKLGLAASVEIVETGCMGLCHSEPTVELVERPTGRTLIYGHVTPENAADILTAGMAGSGEVATLDRSWYVPEDEDDFPGCHQTRIVLRNSGRINPSKIEDYLAHSGYQALSRVLTAMTPDEVIDLVEASGLRGRGGGGFPTGKKWRFAAGVESDDKYVICNADEGDPGAFMDRAILEGDPHAVLEAMAITGYAIGARHGIIYIRAEYPLAIERLETALKQAREAGLIGAGILATGFSFDIEIKYGAGAFVCGEETALIQSVEGMRGMPTYKPPFPAIAGLWGKPTIVNNVETLANICPIIRKGARWFRSIGTENSPGTKVFALAGKVNRVGLVEVPMGTTLRQVVFEMGGGIVGGKAFKAVQTGGPSGGCLTDKNLDLPIDYDTLKAKGSMMGSGGMIVMDEDDCMVDVAKFFLDFTMEESCGKCMPCRIGSKQLFMVLDRISKGNGVEGDVETIRTIAQAMTTASLCALGQTAPNPVLSTLRHFPEEYRAHIVEKRCPAKRCSELLTYTIDAERCIGCTLCSRSCPVKCISGKVKAPHRIDERDCLRCGECLRACKFEAVVVR
ncbi:NADH dehydrogenase [Geomonas sp. Red276]